MTSHRPSYARSLSAVAWALALGLVAMGCVDSADVGAAGSKGAIAADQPTVPDPTGSYDPVAAGEPLPDGFRQVLGRDDIRPIYQPKLVPHELVSWSDNTLVIGVDLNGEARAYPVGYLTQREIVNDDHRGIPTLVTW